MINSGLNANRHRSRYSLTVRFGAGLVVDSKDISPQDETFSADAVRTKLAAKAAMTIRIIQIIFDIFRIAQRSQLLSRCIGFQGFSFPDFISE